MCVGRAAVPGPGCADGTSRTDIADLQLRLWLQLQCDGDPSEQERVWSNLKFLRRLCFTLDAFRWSQEELVVLFGIWYLWAMDPSCTRRTATST